MGRLQNIEKRFSFGIRVFYNLFRLFPLLYSNWELPLLFTALTTAAAVGNEIVTYRTGTIPGKFYLYLIEKNEPKFWHLFMVASFEYIGLCLIMAISNFFAWCLYIMFRKNLVQCLHSLYYCKNFYFRINGIDNEGIDNPDQRITQDADKLTKLLGTNIIPVVLLSPFIVTYYTVKTWRVCGGWGVGMIFAYFLIGLIINRILIGPLTPWAARVEKCEGDFRFKHVSVRTNSEESAISRAQTFEHIASEASFDALFRRLQFFVIWRFPSQFFQNFFDYYGALLSYILQVFPIFIFGMYNDLTAAEFSEQISNNSFFFIYLINCFTRLTDLAMNFAELGGYVMRISEFVDHGKDHAKCVYDQGYTNVVPLLEGTDYSKKTTKDSLVIKNLTVAPPTSPGSQIIQGLSISLPFDKSLLITGPSGVGKTSLIRVIAKLWPAQNGTAEVSYDEQQTFYLPQKSYFPVGKLSLLEQLAFPRSVDHLTDRNKVAHIIDKLKLNHLLALCGGMDESVDFEWQETLSPGEQQRLCFARMLLAEPKIVFLDESACHVDESLEEIMYSLLRQNETQYVSVGHRNSLRGYHDFELRLIGPNKNLFHPIQNTHI